MTIYTTRYQASKDKRSDEITVKVCGGYTIMTAEEYRIWRGQR